MSDFGTMIIVQRKDRNAVGPADRALLNEAIGALRNRHGDESDPIHRFRFNVGESQSNEAAAGFFVGLTEYWSGHDDVKDGCDDKFLLNRDRPFAEQVAKALKESLGDKFEVECYCDWW